MNRLTAFAIISLIPAISLADERPYAFTYEATVPAKGEVELEFYETFNQPRTGGSDSQVWVHQLELGYGITDKFDLAAYAGFRTTSEDSFEPAFVKLRGRYKLLDAGSSPVDLVLYLEVAKSVVGDKPWAIEEKLILGRTYKTFSWAANLIAEQEFPAGGGQEYKVGWSVGAAVEPVQGLRVGAETFGAWTREVDGAEEWTAWAGPTGSVALPFLTGNHVNGAWLILGAGFGLNEDSARVRARAILGFDF